MGRIRLANLLAAASELRLRVALTLSTAPAR